MDIIVQPFVSNGVTFIEKTALGPHCIRRTAQLSLFYSCSSQQKDNK